MSSQAHQIADKLAQLRGRVELATTLAGRAPHSVKLLAVSKKFPAQTVALAAQAGQRDFGENYADEALAKIRQLANPKLIWHFIGPLQSNKTRAIAEHFAWVHSLDREKIARRLSEQRPDSLLPLQVCVQVNISAEDSKSGVAPSHALALCQLIQSLPRLQLRGLMAIPTPPAAGADPAAPYRALAELQHEISEHCPGLDSLSAGMSADFEAAISAGSTIVRIGSQLFGARN